jgi:hypothetical protein
MRVRMLGLGVTAVMILQGCAGTGPARNPSAQKSLQSLPLFDADASPRFVLYVACSSDSVNCSTVEHAFDDWANDRHVEVNFVEPGATAFREGPFSGTPRAAMPYRVAVQYKPWMSAGYTSTSLNSGGGSFAPMIGYSATIYVFDASTGKLLQTVPAHGEQSADSNKGPANPYIRAEVRNFLTGLDPGYAAKP